MTVISTTPLQPSVRIRHDRLTIALHWITAFLVLSQFASAHIWEILEKGTTIRIDLIMIHLAFGMLLAVTVVIRVVWRVTNRRRLPSAVTGIQHLAAEAVHMLLYGLLVAQVALGFVFG